LTRDEGLNGAIFRTSVTAARALHLAMVIGGVCHIVEESLWHICVWIEKM